MFGEMLGIALLFIGPIVMVCSAFFSDKGDTQDIQENKRLGKPLKIVYAMINDQRSNSAIASPLPFPGRRGFSALFGWKTGVCRRSIEIM